MTGLAPGRGAASSLPVPGGAPFAVVAAHRTGQPLHPELVALGAHLDRVARTTPAYRMIALPGPGVPRGGIVRVREGGAAVEVELHVLPVAALHALAVPPPLVIGRVELAGGLWVAGLVCTRIPDGARDITEHGSWPAYLASG